MGPPYAALDGMGARHEEPLLLPLQIDQPRRFRRAVGEDRIRHQHHARARRLRRVHLMSVIASLADIDPRELIGKGKVGLLTATGTYDVERYPWAYEFWKRQQQTHWMGEEVPLGADIKDWASHRVTDSDRALLTQIFRFFTQSDVEV